MKLIKTKYYPFGRFRAITHYPLGVYYKRYITLKTVNHESIHWQQQKELLIVFFYIIYAIEWLFKGYRGVSFEKEAYKNESNFDYLENRKRFAMWRKNYEA